MYDNDDKDEDDDNDNNDNNDNNDGDDEVRPFEISSAALPSRDESYTKASMHCIIEEFVYANSSPHFPVFHGLFTKRIT